ncbi:MAG: beta-lactamase family protein [Gammaproteobacteria bacterium]|nr:beta-lactamase family protein [Gammaproteobacteria bacterium]NND38505.1 beta-lactamase family protein [Pseudomonadales bacterium]RZV54608.1 MAG: class A beta-lactamase-related serine hydrolase [Pseudomonadales bacterium]
MNDIPKKLQVHGTVATGFESVKQLYEQQMQTMLERDTQLCVYYRGEKVVDLWATDASAAPAKSFSADSLINVFSSGKSLEAIAIASLVSKGLISYDARITQYWPEFGANGKDGLTVAQLMRHEAGLANFDTSIDLEDLFTENIKKNAIGKIIEKHAQTYKEGGGSKREYHALTRGWIVNEVFRRVDPAGRTIGEFLREQVSGPLDADVMVGVKAEDMQRIAPVHLLSPGRQLLESLKPNFLGRGIVHNFFQIMRRLIMFMPLLIKARRLNIPPPFLNVDGTDFFNHPGFAKGETPSANANCSARGLAKIAAMMAAGGKWQGAEYMSTQAWKAMHENPLRAHMGALLTTRFTQGGVDSFTDCGPDCSGLERDLNNGREGFYGWMGLGGSIFQWHPQRDIGFAFLPTSLHLFDLLNERGKIYQAEVLKCTANG